MLISDASPNDECVGGEHGHEGTQTTDPPGRLAPGREHVSGVLDETSQKDPDTNSARQIKGEDEPVSDCHESDWNTSEVAKQRIRN